MNRLLTMAGALLLLGATSKLFSVPAVAQSIRAALVKNTDEKGRNPYTANVNSEPFLNSEICNASEAVPSGMQLVVENVNLHITLPKDQQFNKVVLDTDNAETYCYLPSQRVGTFGSADSYYVNANITAYVNANITPIVLVQPALTVDGAITGYLVNVSN